MYDTLVGLDDGGKIVPRLAEKWEQSATGATFTLKKGVTCSDGKPLTASQVAASLKRYQTTSAGTALTFGPGNTGSKTTITGDDKAGTVTVELGTPWGELLPGLSSTATGIVCAPGLRSDGLGAGAVPGAGTGAYEMTKTARGSSYELTLRKGFDAWPRYASMPPGAPAGTLRISVVKDESTLANQLQTGALDVAPFTGPDAARFANGDHSVRAAPLIRNFVAFNQRAGHPGADAEIRKAVAQALDPKAFNQVFGGAGQEMTSYVDAQAACVSTDTSLLTTTDAVAAEKILKGVRIKLVGSNAVGQGAGNTYVQEALRAAGAEVKLTNADNASWATQVLGNEGDWDVTVFPLISGRLANGGVYFVGESPAKGRNFGAVDNKKFLAGYAAATTTVDQNAKCAAWQQAQDALLKRNDVVPLATVNVHYVFRKGVSAAIPAGSLDPSTLRVSG
ncbi:peptide/nickel transport system substrate-binding protein [Streptomyces sp. V4I23]|uniref:ABC transporter substrate-binding protein n=1 Tax=Streptomyces sp. V4I23 TaxID=3042282 RepID=UPI0027828828|nr:ABC transporter substrate-binding protein [Streptomyces sp. V4I23]MDQ1007811.1 peptide/nickel transport system substrate-binding protein [Streptomyces sp. V4I23]